MFRIGEFSRIARVSGRLLRYYDSIGLLIPRRIDAVTGYRYYGADQLPRLNRILALKELGLSLEQIARMVDDDVPTAEIRGMLVLRKAELERTLSESAVRLRDIDSRLRQIDEQGSPSAYEVVLKSAPAMPFLAARKTYPGMNEVLADLRAVADAGRRLPAEARDALVVVAHSDFEDEDLDLEMGFTLKERTALPAPPPGFPWQIGRIEAADQLATVVRRGPAHQSHLAFGALGVWMDAHGFAIAGPSREVFVALSFDEGAQNDTVMEVQFPVAKAM